MHAYIFGDISLGILPFSVSLICLKLMSFWQLQTAFFHSDGLTGFSVVM